MARAARFARVVAGALAMLVAAYGLALFRAFQYGDPGWVAEQTKSLTSRSGGLLDVAAQLPLCLLLVALAGAALAWRVRSRGLAVAVADAGFALLPLTLLGACLWLDDVTTRQIIAAAVLGLTAWRCHPLALGDVSWSGMVPLEVPVKVRARTLAALMCVGAAAFLWAGALARHEALWSSQIDLGLFYELFDNKDGRLLYAPTLGQSFLGEHFSPILVVLWPFVALFRSPEALLAIQALSIALGGWLLYLWAEGRTRSPLVAAAIALAWLVSPFVQNAAFYDFHMDLLEPPLLFGLMLALDRKRLWTAVALCVGLWCTKEDTWIYTAVIALWAAFDGRIRADRRMRKGIVIVGLVGLVVGAVLLTVVMPALRAPHDPAFFSTTGPSKGYAFVSRYSHLAQGGGMGGIVKTLVANPFYLASHLASGPRLGNLLVLLSAFAGVASASRWGLVLLLPSFEMLLADPGLMSSYAFYYGAVAFMFAPLAAVVGAEALLARPAGATGGWGRVTPGRLAVAIVAITVGLAAFHPASLVAREDQYRSHARTPHHELAFGLMERVPEGAKVSATGYLAVHMLAGRDVRMFPYELAESEWLLVDLQRPPWPLSRPDVEARLRRALTQGFTLDAAIDGLVLMHKGAAGDSAARLDTFLSAPRIEAELSEQTNYIDGVGHDPEASNTAYLRASPSAARGPGYLLYGPFVNLGPGRYHVTYRIRFSDVGVLLPPADAPAATLDVVVKRGREKRASKDFTVGELGAEAGHWVTQTLDVTLARGDSDLEARVYWHGFGALDVDVVDITPSD